MGTYLLGVLVGRTGGPRTAEHRSQTAGVQLANR